MSSQGNIERLQAPGLTVKDVARDKSHGRWHQEPEAHACHDGTWDGPLETVLEAGFWDNTTAAR